MGISSWINTIKRCSFLRFIVFFCAFFALELFAFFTILPGVGYGLIFGALWSALLSSVLCLLPQKASRIVFGILYFLCFGWTVGQTGYYQVFGKLMWLATLGYAGEGAAYVGGILQKLGILWWIFMVLLLALGIFILVKFSVFRQDKRPTAALLITLCASLLCIFVLPELLYPRANQENHTDGYADSLSYRTTYDTMYDAHKTYALCGIYHMTVRDIGNQIIAPFASKDQQSKDIAFIEEYFSDRKMHQDNEMTGLFAGKNVVFVIMESTDDWLITPEDTPTIYRLMNSGISFTEFYTPGFGSVRTLNSEFCLNSGVYLPTTGNYVFDYLENDFSHSMIAQFATQGYNGQVFHFNTSDFYSRGLLEPAFGYEGYNSYLELTDDEELLLSETYLFDNEQLSDLFFRDGLTFNTVITRSAHLPYNYDDPQSEYALSLYPEYRGKYGSEEEDCARAKIRLVDDFFTRLIQELEARGQLENTVIIGVTDHYAMGYSDIGELLEFSGVTEPLLVERTPFFIWSADTPTMKVNKTLNTTDLLPTVLNLWGINSPYTYLGQDAFDPNYEGYALFPDGSWISDGVVCSIDVNGKIQVLANEKGKTLSEDYLDEMCSRVLNFIQVNNLILTTDYYAK